MNCPKCSADLKPWPWQDGGYKGVQCTGCEARWWSGIAHKKRRVAKKRAARDAAEERQFQKLQSDRHDWATCIVWAEEGREALKDLYDTDTTTTKSGGNDGNEQ